MGHPREIDWSTNHAVLIAVKGQHTLSGLSELAELARRFPDAEVDPDVLALVHALATDPDFEWVPAEGAETTEGSEIAETTTTTLLVRSGAPDRAEPIARQASTPL